MECSYCFNLRSTAWGLGYIQYTFLYIVSPSPLDEVSVFSQPNFVALFLETVFFQILVTWPSTSETSISKPGHFSEKHSCCPAYYCASTLKISARYRPNRAGDLAFSYVEHPISKTKTELLILGGFWLGCPSFLFTISFAHPLHFSRALQKRRLICACT